MSITATERTEIEKLLVLMFNAAPGATYLAQVVNIYEQLGHNLQQLANNLDDIPAFQSLHPNFQTAAEFAADFLTPLGLQADAVAVAFVTDKFNAGVAKGEIMYEGLLALEGVGSGAAAQYVAAKAILDNKTAVSEYYSVTKAVDQTDLNTLQLVLNGVTSDPATVTAAKSGIDNGTLGTSGIEATLTPSQDTVVGTTSSDTINGLFGDATVANNTYTAGDSIDGAAGVDRLNLVALGTTASQAITVKNVESINIQDTVGATFNALLVENAPGISFNSTVTGMTSKVTNAALASVMGFAGKGNLTVDYLTTSGSTDTANLALAGVGTSSTAPSTIDVGDTNTVEKINVATSGTNFVKLTGGTVAASLTVTGSGTNTFSLSAADSLAAVATIDASASTGTNTFALGANLNTGSTIKGGTGADTVSVTFGSATLVAPAITGVETLATTFTAGAVVDLGTATGLTTVTASDKGAAATTMTFQNAQASVTGLTVSNVDAAAADSALKFSYGATTKGDLALKVGSTSATATAVNLGAVTITNSNSLAVTTLGALDHDMDVLTVKGNQSSLSFNVAAGGGLTTGGTTATGNIGALSVTTGAASYYSGGIVTLSAGKNLGDVTLTATGNKGELDGYYYTKGGNIGNISLNVTGNDFSGDFGAAASGGSVGNVSVSVTGDDADISFWVSGGYASGSSLADLETRDVGNITMTVNGDNNTVSGDVTAVGGSLGDINISVTGDGNTVSLSGHSEHVYYYDGTIYTEVGGGNVGNVTLSVDGDSSGYFSIGGSGGSIGDVNVAVNNDGDMDLYLNASFGSWSSGFADDAGSIGNINVQVGKDSNFYSYVSANGGDIGNVTVNVNGSNASGWFSLRAVASSGHNGNDSYDYLKGGNIGDVSLTIDGDNSEFEMKVLASGGSIGDVSVSVNGSNASGYIELDSQAHKSGSPGGNVGAVNVTLGDDTYWSVNFDVDGTMGPVTVTGGDNVYFEFSGGGGYTSVTDLADSALISSVTLNFGDDAQVGIIVSGFSGSVGNIVGTFGDGASDWYLFNNINHNVGSLTLNYGTGASTYINYGGNDNAPGGSIGAVNYTAGAGSTFYDVVSGGTATTSIGKVTLTGGDSSSSAGVYVSDLAIATHGGVDASAWLGTLGVDLSAVQLGTTIRVGAAGSSVTGTEGADNIFLGAGVDTVTFDATPTNTDVIFTFTVGAGKDVMDLTSATTLKAVETVDAAYTAVTGDILRLVDIAAGQDVTTKAGLAAALSTGGEYVLHDFTAGNTVTVITAASATASTFYVFEVTDADGGADTLASEITLVGVVNATAASAIGGLVIGNFA